MSITDITRKDIEDILTKEFAPLQLEVLNDSASHKGHAEALLQPKAGHYKVMMKSAMFNGLSAVKRHRMVYEKLSELMDSKIHAISMKLFDEQE